MAIRNQGRRWCFTINNWSPADVERLDALPDVRYLVYGRERGDSGTPHLQGYIVYNGNRGFRGVCRDLGGRAHVERALGTSLQCANYCKKDGDYTEKGDVPANQGRRTDWDEFKEWVLAKSADGERITQKTIILEFPCLWARYHQRCIEIADAFAPHIALVDGNPNPGWQSDIVERTATEANARVVDFVVDLEGNAGKSWICAYLFTNRPDDVQILRVGKEADMCHAIDETKTVFLIDVPRSRMQFFQYSVVEMLKDRLVFSTKYNSRMKILKKIPHVVVFCNETPDMNKLSADRYNIIYI